MLILYVLYFVCVLSSFVVLAVEHRIVSLWSVDLAGECFVSRSSSTGLRPVAAAQRATPRIAPLLLPLLWCPADDK